MSLNTDNGKPKRVLFAGYAPVHFVCFLPVYRRLREDPRVELWLSGGFKKPDNEGYEIDGLYDSFPVDRERVIPWEEAADLSFDAVVCAHTSMTLFPRETGTKVLIFHGVSFKNLAVREKVLDYDLLCLPGRYHGERFRARGLVRPDATRCLITGFPKVDRLSELDVDRPSFLHRLGLDPNLPTVLFAPTGGKHNSLEMLGGELISALTSVDDWNLLIKPHDHPKQPVDFALLEAATSTHVRLLRDYDITDYLCVADVLVTDASSVAVEFTLLDRPIVFIDAPRLLKGVIKKGAPLDLQTYGHKIGFLACGTENVAPMIRKALDEPGAQHEIRTEMARHLFHKPGTAARRVEAVVLHAAGVEKLPDDIEVLQP